MAERVVAEVAGRAGGTTTAPAILGPLPAESRVPRSERYVARDLLGHAFLPGGVLATYTVGGREAELFFSDLGDAEAAAAAAARLRAHHSQRGATVRERAAIGGGGFVYEDPAWGCGAVVVAGRRGRQPRPSPGRRAGPAARRARGRPRRSRPLSDADRSVQGYGRVRGGSPSRGIRSQRSA
jgi:hypothetical protein